MYLLIYTIFSLHTLQKHYQFYLYIFSVINVNNVQYEFDQCYGSSV